MNKKRIALTLFLAFLSEIANKIIPLISLHFAANRLGTASFGVSQFAIWLLDWGVLATAYGFSQIGPVMLRADKSQEAQRRVHGSIVASRLALALVSAITLGVLVQEHSVYAPYKWAVISSITILFTSAIDAGWILIARQKMALWSVLSILAKFGSLLLILNFVQDPEDTVKFVIITNLANSFISICSFMIALKLIGLRLPSTQELRKAFKLATPFAVSTSLMLVMDRYDLFLVERYLGTSETGIYAAATKLVGSIFPLILAVTTIFYSEMMAQSDRESIERHLKASVFWACSALGPVLVGVWFVDNALLSLVFGEGYASGGAALSVLMLSMFFYGMITIFGFQLLTLKGLWKPLVFSLALGTLAGIFSGSSLISTYGTIAAAWSSLIAKLIGALFLLHVALKVWSLNGSVLLKQTWRGCLPSIVMGAALVSLLMTGALPSGLTGIIALGCLIYAFSFVIFNLREVIEITEKAKSALVKLTKS